MTDQNVIDKKRHEGFAVGRSRSGKKAGGKGEGTTKTQLDKNEIVGGFSWLEQLELTRLLRTSNSCITFRIPTKSEFYGCDLERVLISVGDPSQPPHTPTSALIWKTMTIFP